MRWTRPKWTRNLLSLSVLLLVTPMIPRSCTLEEVDSYCQLYTKVIRDKGDEQIKAPLAVKKRLLVNEQLYYAVCPQTKA